MSYWGRTTGLFGFSGLQRRTGLQVESPLSFTRRPTTAVNFDTAMSVSAFWACVKLLAEAIGSMPLECYAIGKDGRRETVDHSLWRLMAFNPNRYQTRQEFFETLVMQLIINGNCYAAIERIGGKGRITSLLPLMSSQMQVVLQDDGAPQYRYTDSKGNMRVFAAESIWHIKQFGNGVVGLSTIGYMAKTLGVALDSDDRAATLAASGGKTNGVLMVDKILNKEQRAAIRENFRELTEGNSDELFVLEADMKYERTSLSPQDMQLLETRRFQIEDVCRFLGVPSVLVNDSSQTTTWGSGISQLVQGFYKLNLRPMLSRFEASMARHLLDPSEWHSVEFRFNFDELLRPDRTARLEANSAAINSAQLTPDEARATEGLPPLPGGDKLYLNSTMVPAGQVARNLGGGQTSEA